MVEQTATERLRILVSPKWTGFAKPLGRLVGAAFGWRAQAASPPKLDPQSTSPTQSAGSCRKISARRLPDAVRLTAAAFNAN